METFKHIHLEYLQTISEGNDTFVLEMLQMLHEEIPPLLIEMQLMLQQENWHRVNRIAHKLKPHFEMLGIKSLFEDIRKIEKFALEKSNLEKLPELIHQTETIATEALEELKNDYLK